MLRISTLTKARERKKLSCNSLEKRFAVLGYEMKKRKEKKLFSSHSNKVERGGGGGIVSSLLI